MMRQRSDELELMVLDEQVRLSLREVCVACDVPAEWILEMVEEGVIAAEGPDPSRWRFSGRALVRAQKALRLRRDLRVNWAGAALALELMDEVERLHRLVRAAGLEPGRRRF